jgi:PAS domain S-box-containing protein
MAVKRRGKPAKAKAKRPVSRPAGRQGPSREDLERRLAAALEQQAATSEILRVITASPGDARPVFEAIVTSAARLCEAEFSAVVRLDSADGLLHIAALSNLSADEAKAFHSLFPRPPRPNFVLGRAFVEAQPVQLADVLTEADYDAHTRDVLQRVARYRTFLGVPIVRDGAPIGVIGCARRVVKPFTDAEVALVRTFADQAVIAIENVRLFQELEARNRDLAESLEQQTATGEILRVISSSPTDVQPVFDAVAHSAARLLEVSDVSIFRRDGDRLRLVAHLGAIPAQPMLPLVRGTSNGRAVLDARTVHVLDMQAETAEFPEGADNARLMGHRTTLTVPLIRDGAAVGTIHVRRTAPRLFTPRQVGLLQTFADQAVIAIENVRLFTELERRNHALTEALDQQTATSEILRVISQSQTDAQPVFDTIVRNAVRLCGGVYAGLYRVEGGLIHFVAQHNFTPEQLEQWRRTFPRPADGTGMPVQRAVRTGEVCRIGDVTALEDAGIDPLARAGQRARSVHSLLLVPMFRQGDVIGVIAVTHVARDAFTDAHVDLLRTFADQAVIAIENVRLFTELQRRNRDLTESLEQQTATGEILRVISSSPTDVQPVFEAVVSSAARLCDAFDAAVHLVSGDVLRMVAHDGPIEPDTILPLAPGAFAARVISERRSMQVADLQAETDAYPVSSEFARNRGFHTILSVPLLRGAEAIGVITIRRTEVRPFSDRQAELLKTFADQAVIAIENVRLFKELEARNSALTESLEQQTATSEILRVISRSPTDVQPIFETIVRNAVQLSGAERGALYRFDGELVHLVAHHNNTPETLAALQAAYPMRPDRSQASGRAILGREVAEIVDVRNDPEYRQEMARRADFGSLLAVPMLRADGAPIGAIVIQRSETGSFARGHVELLKTFADQAVIAVENVRLFQELRARTRDLTRSVDELRALGEVTQAVSSTLDLETVLATIVSRAVELSGCDQGIVYEFVDGSQTFEARATHRISSAWLEAIRQSHIRLGEGVIGRAGMLREPVQIDDLEASLQVVAPQVREILAHEGMRSLLALPLVREDRLLGGLVILRRVRGEFPVDVVALLRTFAAQSVLAIHNARLFHEIQRQKQYSEAVVETSPVAIATLDLDGKVVGWNPGAERLFGYTPAEAIGRQLEDLVATPEMREEVREGLRLTVTRERVRAIRQRARKDGTLVDVETAAVPVVVDGVDVGIIAIYHDITDLVRARREAEAANEAKTAFLATMSHEIRTPMNAVIGMSGLLLNTALDDEQREYAEVVRQSGDTLLTVINDILDFSKIEAGRLELEAQPFDVRECVESALDLVATRAAEKGLDLAYLIADGTPTGIVGDVTRLRQVLLNLLSNAVKFTERGEVVLSVRAQCLDDVERFFELSFSVRDTGIGIPADRLDRLFQSFTQVDASTTRRYGGTGLGLAISQRLTELMGGRIAVTSEPGRGSDFHFTVRAAEAQVPVATHRDLSGLQPALHGKRVLVVDDNATNRRILTAHLGAWGVEARATEFPAEALEWVRGGGRFEIGVLDMHMPGMDGVDLAQAIREHLGDGTPPLILFTSLGRREARAESAGFAAYLSKPIKPSQLFDALMSVLPDQPVHVPQRGATRREFDPDMARRHPLRILLAEDNVVNQKLALRLLAQMGYRADLAANGHEAIEAVERQTYDVVLMDVQMPELDGFEASREINRRWPGALRPRIVAMTANAMQGDRDLCVAAGMDDYVAKPVRVEELVGALERCARRPDADERGAPPTAAVDRAVIERLTATTGAAFVAELIDTFLEDGGQLVATLRRALSANDVDTFRRAAHSLKSTGESLGATELAGPARELEAMARAGSLAGAEARLEALVARYEATALALGDVRRGLTG